MKFGACGIFFELHNKVYSPATCDSTFSGATAVAEAEIVLLFLRVSLALEVHFAPQIRAFRALRPEI